MRLAIPRENVARVARLAVTVEAVALLAALVLGVAYSALTATAPLDSFLLMAFVIFVLMLIFAVLSGPGMFHARPKFVPVSPEGRGRWRAWLSVPQVGKDQPFFELVLFTGLAFLLLVIATGIGALLGGSP